jgi:hypothetical protein
VPAGQVINVRPALPSDPKHIRIVNFSAVRWSKGISKSGQIIIGYFVLKIVRERIT